MSIPLDRTSIPLAINMRISFSPPAVVLCASKVAMDKFKKRAAMRPYIKMGACGSKAAVFIVSVRKKLWTRTILFWLEPFSCLILRGKDKHTVCPRLRSVCCDIPPKRGETMSHCPSCPTRTVVDPPQYVYENVYHPQVVQVVHPVQLIRQHHCVPVPHHIAAFSEKDVWCSGYRGKVAGRAGKSKRRIR